MRNQPEVVTDYSYKMQDEQNSLQLLNSYIKSIKAEHRQPKKQTYYPNEMLAISIDDKGEMEYYKSIREY